MSNITTNQKAITAEANRELEFGEDGLDFSVVEDRERKRFEKAKRFKKPGALDELDGLGRLASPTYTVGAVACDGDGHHRRRFEGRARIRVQHPVHGARLSRGRADEARSRYLNS